MDRLFSALLLALLLMLLPAAMQAGACSREEARGVFFSMLFPQLMPGAQQEQATAPEAVYL